MPGSCSFENGIATAQGAFSPSLEKQGWYYERYGAVVELHVYASPDEKSEEHTQRRQLLKLQDEQRAAIGFGNKTWTVTAPFETQPETAVRCEVGV
jgi:hypothetical protein